MSAKLRKLFIITVFSVAILFTTACTDGLNIMSPNSGAKRAYDVAVCLQQAGDDWQAAQNCK